MATICSQRGIWDIDTINGPIVLPTGASTDNKLNDVITAINAISGVGGPSGGLTNTELRASPLPISGTATCNAGSGTMAVSLATAPTTPVTGTFWPATQPVSGSVSVSNLPATQPVSGPLTDTQLRATPLPVSGSLTVSGGLTNVELRLTPVPISGTFWQATQPVSIASMPSTPVTGTFWQATQPISAPNLDVALSTRLKPADTLAAVTAVGSITNPVAVTQSGTWTVQPGNTANTTAWKVDGSAITQPVSGTFWPVTQPVSGTFWQATQPVSGTFFQATQPVSIASMPSTPVTGTFWQATQPVSIASMPSTPVTMAGGNPCENPSATLVSATGATAGTAAVQIVALSGTTKIYICSLNVIGVSGTTPTFSLVQGTGVACATGQTVVQQSWTTAAGTIYAFANPVAVGASGNALCYLDTGTTPIQKYTLTYIQQ